MREKGRCRSTCFGVLCTRREGHDGEHRGYERGRGLPYYWDDDWSDVSRDQPRHQPEAGTP